MEHDKVAENAPRDGMDGFDAVTFVSYLDGAIPKAAKPLKIVYRHRQGYSKDVGFYLKPSNGKRTYKRWWLGHDQSRALWLASVITAYFEHFVRSKGGLWVPHHLRAIKMIIEVQDDQTKRRISKARSAVRAVAERPPLVDMPLVMPAIAIVSSQPVVRSKKIQEEEHAPTLYGAMTAYLSSMEQKRMSPSHLWRARQIIDHDLRQLRPDRPLDQVNYIWLDELADHFKSRPPRKRDGKPISPQTVVTSLRYLRAFFTWIDDSEFGGWQGPAKLARPFRASAKGLMTSSELKSASNIKQFDIQTLVKLYAKANDLQRTLMLSALFMGATQQELTVMEKDEFNLQQSTVSHFRNKTMIEGNFWLPPELVQLLSAQFRRRRKDKLAFRTPDDNPLVVFQNGRQTSDFVRQTWDDLRVAAELPSTLSFKFLRKFVADWMMRNAGEEIGQIALSHARKTILTKHYTSSRDFERLGVFQRKMYKELCDAGMFSITSKT